MLNKIDFNFIIKKLENKFFTNQKKNIKFIKKFFIYLKYKRSLVFIHSKLQEYFFIFARFESLFGKLPNISRLKRKRKGKLKKKIIFLRAFLVIKSSCINEYIINNILDYIFNLHNYFYIKFLLKRKKKIIRFEEIVNSTINKHIYIQHNSLSFENNLYFKWLDLNRSFINIEEINRIFNRKKRLSPIIRKLKFYNSKLIIYSNYFKFFISPLRIFIKNYRKLLLFLFKKFRKKKKNEKTYILL